MIQPQKERVGDPKVVHRTKNGLTYCDIPYESLKSYEVLASTKGDIFEAIEKYDRTELCRFCYTESVCKYESR